MSKEHIEDATPLPVNKVHSSLRLMLDENDKVAEARKFLKAAGESVAGQVMRTWLAEPGTYDIDIIITMEKK